MRLSFSQHAQTRMQQRGFSERDIELIVRCGSIVRRGLRLLKGQDIDHEMKQLKRRIQDLERLRNCAVVMDDDKIITCYHLHGEAGRKALKQTKRRPRRSIRRN